MRISALIAALALSVSSLACSNLSALSPARQGDLPALKKALDEDFRGGRLTRDAVTELSRALASHELRVATGNDAIRRAHQVSPCAGALDNALLERVERKDDVSAVAALLLLDAHRGDALAWHARASDENSAWRAVGTRTLQFPVDGELRRARMVDPDETVRLAAVRVSEEAFDFADRGVLGDVARRDPNEQVRAAALRALSATADAQVVTLLKDLWPLAGESTRQGIVAAWGWTGAFSRGGLEQIVWAAETQEGTASLVAGGILMRHGGDSRGPGLAAVAKGMRSGAVKDRAFAVTLAPLDDARMLELLVTASKESEPKVQVAALERLAGDEKHRAKSLATLGQLSVAGGAASGFARAAMARLGDRRVTTLLVEDAKSSRPELRERAAQLLTELGDWGRAAQALADPDVDVRTRVACRLLVSGP